MPAAAIATYSLRVKFLRISLAAAPDGETGEW
jgi:hypothetical protein